MNSKFSQFSQFSQTLMVLPMYFLLSYAGIFNGTYLAGNHDLHHVLSQNSTENNDNLVTKTQIIGARDDQNDKNKSCLNRGECTV